MPTTEERLTALEIQMADRSAQMAFRGRSLDLSRKLISYATLTNRKLDELTVGQEQIRDDVTELGADVTELRTEFADLRKDHGGRLDRIETTQEQIIDVMNDNFGRLFALLKKDEPA